MIYFFQFLNVIFRHAKMIHHGFCRNPLTPIAAKGRDAWRKVIVDGPLHIDCLIMIPWLRLTDLDSLISIHILIHKLRFMYWFSDYDSLITMKWLRFIDYDSVITICWLHFLLITALLLIITFALSGTMCRCCWYPRLYLSRDPAGKTVWCNWNLGTV